MPSILSSLASSSSTACLESGPHKRIVNFVKNVTNPASPNYMPEEERIAVFDNDGTLWSEKALLP
jgi:hypothetical protein